jgi:DNA-binding transcriptional regulator YiaG
MNYEESIKYLRRKSHSAYEIHKATGLNEASLRKVLKGEVAKPQRKTKEALIDYVNQLEGLNDFSESDFNTLNIKKIRTNLHLTQTAIGKLLGVGIRTVQLWESGERKMSKTAEKLLNELILKESNIITDELTLNQINPDQHLLGDLKLGSEKFNIDIIVKQRKMLGLTWDYLAEGLPIAGNSLRIAFKRRSVGEVFLNHVMSVIEDYNKKQGNTDIVSSKFGEGIVLESYASDVMKNHEKLLLNSNYKNWFELQVYKKVLEVMSK